MANRLILGVLALLVFGGGAVWWFSSQAVAGLDSAGIKLLQRHRAMLPQALGAQDPDAEALRELLRELLAHPDRDAHRGLRLAQAWVQQRLGNSRRAWEALEANMADPEALDLQLGAEVLQGRHAAIGDEDLADQARACAEQHYLSSGDVSSLFRAWQMAIRADDLQQAADYAKDLQEHADTREAKTVAALGGYPLNVDDSPQAGERFARLLDAYDEPPEELSLALAWWEISKADTLLAGQRRAEAVQRVFRVSKTARFIIAAAGLQLKQYKTASSHLEWLLGNHPQDPRAKIWRQVQAAVRQAMADDK